MKQTAMRNTKITILGLTIALISFTCLADGKKVYAKQFVGKASTNWDLLKGQTEITDIYLQVVGPSDLSDEAASFVEVCAYKSLIAAYLAYDAQPSEATGKLAVAWTTFKAHFWFCTRLAITEVVREKFVLGIARVSHLENGIYAMAKFENPIAVALDKYVIEHAPRETRNFLSFVNHAGNPSWSFSTDELGFTTPLLGSERTLGIRLPTPSWIIMPVIAFAEISKIKIDLPKVNVPKIKW